MKANEIFSAMSDELASSVFSYLRQEQREVYTAALVSMTARRNLRPVFIQKKSGDQQVTWMVKQAKMRGSEEIGEHVLQLWLMKGHSEMLIDFLDSLGIEHDGEGAADDIPDEFDADKLKETVATLKEKYGAELTRVYLQVFQLQRSNPWPEIDEAISTLS